MKISDFTIVKQVDPDHPEAGEVEWLKGSRSAMIATGKMGGKTYQLKVHASEPVWNNTDLKIRETEEEIARCTPDRFLDKQRLEGELESLKRNKPRLDKSDQIADTYVDFKQRLSEAISTPADPQLIGPIGFWKEGIPGRPKAIAAVEAVPWVTRALGFGGKDSPITFSMLDRSQQYAIVASLCEAVSKLHKRGILHNDLKLSNILVVKNGSNYQTVLIDFDSAFFLDELRSRRDPFEMWNYIIGGTHFSPEYYPLVDCVHESPDEDIYNDFDLNTITEKSDVFSLGVTIYEMFYGRADLADIIPFVDPSNEPLDQALYGIAVAQGYKPALPDSMDELLYGVLNWMFEKEPSDRPTVDQVRDIFATDDKSKIPAKYLRLDLTSPWPEHEIEYIPKDRVVITKIPTNKNLYRVNFGGMLLSLSPEELVKRGLAKKTGEAARKEGNARLFWPPEDETLGELPGCVTRSIAVGKYRLSYRGMIKTVSLDGLKEEGVVCTEAEKKTPWPCDKGIRFKAGATIERDLTRGPGTYTVKNGGVESRYTTDELLAANYAFKGVSFALWPQETAEYEPIEAIPDTVASITRSIRLGCYMVSYTDGRREFNLTIQDLVNKGFARRK